jgi:hypothetical protein
MVVEVNSSLNTVKTFQLSDSQPITGLVYSDGLVTVLDSLGGMRVVDWISTSPKVINFSSNPILSGGFFATASSGCSVLGGSSSLIYQMDVSRGQFNQLQVPLNPLTFFPAFQGLGNGPYSPSFLPGSNYIQFGDTSNSLIGYFTSQSISSGIQNGVFWEILGNTNAIAGNYLVTYSIVPDSTVEKTHSISNGSNLVAGRKIIIVDAGSPNSYVDSDRPIPASTVTYPVPTGKSIIEISLYSSGIDKQGEVSMYNT